MAPDHVENAEVIEAMPGQIRQIVMILHHGWDTVGPRGGLSGKLLGTDQPDLPQMAPLQPACTRLGAPQAAPYPPPVIPLQDLCLGALAGRQGEKEALRFAPELRLILFEPQHIAIA